MSKREDICILLDMDGVMVDFVGAACKALGRNTDDVYGSWKHGNYDVVAAIGFGLEAPEMWKTIEALGEDFWVNLSMYPWSQRLYDECVKLADVYFLTKPTYDPRCASGKMIWLQRFLKDSSKARNFLIGPAKHLCGKPKNILVDDADSNVNDFKKYGGNAILWPQIWNSRHVEANDSRLDVVLSELTELIGTI
jgi:5'(3')-deoxyribonucleotidase